MAQTILSAQQLSVLCGGMSMMLRSGAMAQEAAALFAEDNPGILGDVSGSMSAAMLEGMGFAEAAEQTGAFPAYALGVIRTAEMSGRLDEVLERLGDYYQRQYLLSERLRATLLYPTVLLTLMCGVLAVLVFAVLPMFRRVFTSLTGSLAASSYAYVAASAVIGRVSLILAAAAAAAALVLAMIVRTEQGREKLRAPLENFHFTKKAMWMLAASKLADTLATMLSSGVAPEEALAQARDLTEHRGVQEKLELCARDMAGGESVENALFRHGIFPALYGRMLVGGGRSGNTEGALELLAQRLGHDAEEGLTGVIDAAEPVMIGFLTVAVGLTLLSVMLPLLGILAAV